MKTPRQKKIVGLAIGEQSLLAAEVLSGETSDVVKLAEFTYPANITPQHPTELGKALGEFLTANGFTARSAVVGLPAKWMVVKPKEVPPADPATLAEMLRLQAEGEFPSELKDLVYDYANGPNTPTGKSVLLMATHQRYVDSAVTMCEAAGLSAIAVTPTAVALGEATGRGGGTSNLALAIGGAEGGAELTAQSGASLIALRHLRGPAGERSFIGELRRAISTITTNGSGRDMVLWGSPQFDTKSLGTEMGFPVRGGDLKSLGIRTVSASNGQGNLFAPAVAVALAGVEATAPAIDFLHSRLAPPKPQAIPRWAILAGAGALALIIICVAAWVNLQSKQKSLARDLADVDSQKAEVAAAQEFVNKVSFAQGYHAGTPRYLACLKDLMSVVPDDGLDYVTNLTIRENPKQQSTGNKTVVDTGSVVGQLQGKSPDQQRVLQYVDRMKHAKGFSEVSLSGTTPNRNGEVAFTVTFAYQPKFP